MTAEIRLRPIDPARDFAQLASLFTQEQDEPTTESALQEDYAAHKDRIFSLAVAVEENGELLGFHWGTRSRSDPQEAYIYVIVRPERRGQGAGSRLYAALEQAALDAHIRRLKVSVRDDCPGCRAFAERRGFEQISHLIGMTLDLDRLDDSPYDVLIDSLREQDFQFTSMAELGNTAEAQRNLYTLNSHSALDDPGSGGQPSWLSFEDFQQRVCQSDWFRPDGQLLVIDSASGEWVAMSAITRFAGADTAYNLHTGVDRRYRGRKLAQAVKVLALRYARAALDVRSVCTHHDERNAAMIAIDRKLGYVQTPGVYRLEKMLQGDSTRAGEP